MQVPGEEPDSETLYVEQSLLDYAQARGLNFVTFIFNFEPGSCSGFTTLLDELCSADAHYVVMPSLDHLAQHARLQRLRLDRLWHEAAATVLIPASRIRVDA
jgi:hypothetical protein